MIHLWCLKCQDVTPHDYIIDPVERRLDSRCTKCDTLHYWIPTRIVQTFTGVEVRYT
jgi:hypothetical protein